MNSQVERGTVREMVHTIAFRAGVLECILKKPVLGSLEIRSEELAHVQLLQRQIDDLRRYLDLPSAEPERMRGKWLEKEVLDNVDYEIPEWQTEKCSVCGKYHTTPYLYNFSAFAYCPNCGSEMTRGE